MVIYRILMCLVLVITGSVVLADSWSPISAVDAPTARAAHSAVFTRIDGTDQMIVWGGQDSPMVPFANTGARWKRSTNTWAVTTTANAPSGREGQPAVWTGHEMLMWGGDDGLNFLNTGGRYDPVTDTWRPTSLTGAPAGRFGHSFIWSGDRLIVWGGAVGFGGDVNTGAIYGDPVADSWSPTTTVGAPSAQTARPRSGLDRRCWSGVASASAIM